MKRFSSTWPATNPWTKPEPTPSKVALLDLPTAWRGNIPMWLDYLCRWWQRCYERTVLADSARLLLFRGLSSGLLLVFLHGALEIFNRVAKAFAQVAQLAGTKEDQGNDKDNDQFRNAKFSTKHVVTPLIRNRHAKVSVPSDS